jgi:hypothetical protein
MSLFKFIAHGGWVTVTLPSKRKTRRLLSWTLISFGLSNLMVLSWVFMCSPMDSLETSLISWPVFLMVSPVPILGFLTFVCWRFEKPQDISTQVANPNYDPHNLY